MKTIIEVGTSCCNILSRVYFPNGTPGISGIVRFNKRIGLTKTPGWTYDESEKNKVPHERKMEVA